MGDNMEKTVPGYTGYVPTMPLRFGGTYRRDYDLSMEEHQANIKKFEAKEYDLMQSKEAFPTLEPVASDPQVRDQLNMFSERSRGAMQGTRGSSEPPIPGYVGFIPRIHTTDAGLGCNYHEMTKQAFQTFQAEQERHRAVMQEGCSNCRKGRTGWQ